MDMEDIIPPTLNRSRLLKDEARPNFPTSYMELLNTNWWALDISPVVAEEFFLPCK